MITKTDNKVYFNNPQLHTQLIDANTTVVVAGRRTGKTDGIAAPKLLKNIQRMPGSTGGIVVPTFKHGMTNTIPGLLGAWRRWGYIKDLHYTIGKKPPKWFKKPITEPVDYEHVISFHNGSIAIVLSQDRPGAANSLTLSWLMVDEAKFIDYQKLKDEALPANGGIKTHFGSKSCNHSLLVLSDMPISKKGSWFLHYREKMDSDLIECMEGIICEIWRVRQQIIKSRENGEEIKPYLQKYLRHLDRRLNQFRSEATFYKEYSSIENIQLIGEKYIRQMKRDLTPLTFQTSILCKRIGIAKDGFYSNFTEDHLYNASDFSFLDSLGGLNASSFADIDGRADADVNPGDPICIGMDYNANINWIVAGQPSGNRLNVIKSFFVKFNNKIPELIKNFCDYYATHRNKHIIYYYDSTALGSNYAVNRKDILFTVTSEFKRRGWEITPVYLGNPMGHVEKHLLINEGFKGKNHLTPYINRQNNDDLILALSTAGVSVGALGFKKNKAGEKLAETEEDLLEHRTDGTDAFDTLYIGCEKFPQHTSFRLTIAGIH